MSGNPALRREFVGMMFAIAVGEVGLQTAALVQAGSPIRYLPAYSHLLLALFVIAASWVGWSRTQVPAAKIDVNELFEWPFVVLLLDMAMVVIYFILVRTVDFSGMNRRIDPASTVASWHVAIFFLYLIWDLVTKFAMCPRAVDSQECQKQVETKKRVWPTLICLFLSVLLWRLFAAVDVRSEHLLAADLSLLSLVLLFRALKGAIPGPGPITASMAKNRRWAFFLCGMILVGTYLTIFSIPLPLWKSLQDIRTPETGADKVSSHFQ